MFLVVSICIGPHCISPLLVTSGGQDWRPYQTCTWKPHCSRLPLVLTYAGCLPKHIRWANGWYTSYWNAFFLYFWFHTLMDFNWLILGGGGEVGLWSDVTSMMSLSGGKGISIQRGSLCLEGVSVHRETLLESEKAGGTYPTGMLSCCVIFLIWKKSH